MTATPIFVVQHHLATADHYDVRLEIDGVLVSWAVPRGPSTDPRERRLAKRVGDHELGYADFEGVIGEPRADLRGTVQVWDHGTFAMRGDALASEALARGHLSVRLDGIKLRGGWSFIRTADGPDWLMIKKRDTHADTGDITAALPESAVTGRTMEQIAEEAGQP